MLTVLQAIYASNNSGIDVTPQAQAILVNGNDDITPSNAIFGDPDPGSKKYFMIWYTAPPLNGGDPIGLACAEGDSLDLIPSFGAPPYCSTSQQPQTVGSSLSEVIVDRAVYGTANNGFDVTAICQSVFNQGAVGVGTYSIQITNAGFGGDPDPGPNKAFAMKYWLNETAMFIGGGEGQTIILPIAAQPAAETGRMTGPAAVT
jgi:hypothetical protein